MASRFTIAAGDGEKDDRSGHEDDSTSVSSSMKDKEQSRKGQEKENSSSSLETKQQKSIISTDKTRLPSLSTYFNKLSTKQKQEDKTPSSLPRKQGYAWHFNHHTRKWISIPVAQLPPQHDIVMNATLALEQLWCVQRHTKQQQQQKQKPRKEGDEFLPQTTPDTPSTVSTSQESSFSNTTTSSCTNDNKDETNNIKLVVEKEKQKKPRLHRHIVRRGDTFQGICLRYGITPTVLRQVNSFSGTNLLLAPSVLIIPINDKTKNATTHLDQQYYNDCDAADQLIEREANVRAVMHSIDDGYYGTRALSPLEAKCYLEMHNWNVQAAIANAREDAKFEAEEQLFHYTTEQPPSNKNVDTGTSCGLE